MEPSIVTRLDGFQANQKVAKTFPYILIHGSGDALSLVVSCLSEGPLPLVIEYKSKLIKVASVAFSILELSKLLQVFTFDIVTDEDTSTLITNNAELLEASIWTWHL